MAKVYEFLANGFEEVEALAVVDILRRGGVDIKTVSGMLGHFSAGFTLDTYAHVTTAAQKEAANTMGGVLRVAANG